MKPLIFVSSVLFLAFGLVFSVLFLKTNQPLALLSEAKDAKPAYCPINTTLYVHEINQNGQEVPVTIDTHPDINVLQWSITDGQNTTSQPLYFNGLPIIEYKLASDALTFTSLPRTNDLYQKGDVTFLKLSYQTDLFNIVKQEIATCSSPRNPHLCATLSGSESEATAALDTISNITLDCNMTLKAGWVVQRRPSNAGSLSQSTTPSTGECDLNKDGACNTFDLFIVLDDYGKEGQDLPGDINSDGKVNALDYTLMTSKISLL